MKTVTDGRDSRAFIKEVLHACFPNMFSIKRLENKRTESIIFNKNFEKTIVFTV